MRRSGQRWGLAGALACALAWPPAAGATVVADVADGTILREVDAATMVETPLAASLLLAYVVHDTLQAGALTPSTPLAVIAGPADVPTKVDASHLRVDELLQLLLLTGDRTAAHSLALAVGPGVAAARARMRAAAARLRLTDTLEPPAADGPAAVDRAFRTSIRDLAALGLALSRLPEVRRRLDLDGTPIADGGFIVRATRPLIATTARRDAGPTALILGRRGELELLATAAGPAAYDTAWETLEAALERYERRVVIRAGQPVGPLVHVRGGIIPRFTPVAAEQFAITVRRDTAPLVAARLQVPASVDAPVDVNEAVGELVIEQHGELVAVVPLVAPRAIAPRRWLGAMID